MTLANLEQHSTGTWRVESGEYGGARITVLNSIVNTS